MSKATYGQEKTSFDKGGKAASGNSGVAILLHRKLYFMTSDSTENIISHAMYVAKREKLVKKGDLVVFTAGDPATNVITGEGAMTNIMQVIQAK